MSFLVFKRKKAALIYGKSHTNVIVLVAYLLYIKPESLFDFFMAGKKAQPCTLDSYTYLLPLYRTKGWYWENTTFMLLSEVELSDVELTEVELPEVELAEVEPTPQMVEQSSRTLNITAGIQIMITYIAQRTLVG